MVNQQAVIAWIFQNKWTIMLSITLFSFVISTIVLSVEKTDAVSELNVCMEEKKMLSENCGNIVPTTTESTTPSSEEPPTETPTLPPTDSPEEPHNDINYRLPSHVKPINYHLMLNPNLETGEFSGHVQIAFNISEKTKEVILHSKDLDIIEVKITSASNVVIPGQHELVDVTEFLKITLNQEIDVNEEYLLDIDFKGSMLNRIVGLYKSVYLNEAGEDRVMATSKFEPTFARQAYPCFDEPAMKAKYNIKIVRPKEMTYIALSNMPELSTEEYDTNHDIVTFQESVPMSTYLSCFIVSDFLFESDTIKAGGIGQDVLMRVFATPAQLSKVDFALKMGVNVIEYYIQYFKIGFPLPKLDMAAIPDFVSGAMEHWGLVTFRETSLLYDSETSSTANKQRVATVVAHELAHSWFGNLVTMAWWDELWLNEGFASYIEYKGTDYVYPDWKMMDQFLIDDLHSVLTLDATLASHPIVQKAETPSQITELFDSITYNKGAAIIRMLEDFVGPTIFQQGVTNYLNQHQFGTAVTEDLLNEIESLTTDIDVKYIIAIWTKQMGLPVVNVEKISNTEYKLTQKRFLSNPENVDPGNSLWYIPITYTSDVDTTVSRMWFDDKSRTVSITVPNDHKWVKLNKDQIGYYRVNYELDMWQAFTDALLDNIEPFSVSDRAHLLNDVFSLAEATQIEYEVALNLIRYLAKETEYVPWSVASSKIGGLRNLLYYSDLYPKFLTFGRSVIEPEYKKISWTVDATNDADHLKNYLRTTILGLACAFGVPDCITKAGEEFDQWLNNPAKRPHPDLRNLVYYYGMQSVGTEEKWNKMFELFLSEPDASEKSKLMYGLSAIQIPWILKKFVVLAWDEKNVRRQDYYTCLQNIASNRIGESIVWDYVREKWPVYEIEIGVEERYLGRMIPSITSRFNTDIKLQEVKAFFAQYPNAGAGAAAREQTLENIANSIKWLENNEAKIGAWLDKNYPL